MRPALDPSLAERRNGASQQGWWAQAQTDRVYADLSRPPLSARSLGAALVGPHQLWTDVRVLASTPSTNAECAAAARAGAPEGLVVVAESQTAGRGRLDRSWVSPPGAGLTVSVLLRPQVRDQSEWGWLPLMAGLAVVTVLRERLQVESAAVKWPNDVLAGQPPRKLAGLLAEVVAPGAVVIGLGLNVTTTTEELPDTGTSLTALHASTTDRETVLKMVLRELAATYDRWHLDPAGVREDYREVCSSLGRDVAVHLPDGVIEQGRATEVDGYGRLVVGGVARAAGDVVHLR